MLRFAALLGAGAVLWLPLWVPDVAAGGFPHAEGTVLDRAQVEALEDWFPPPFWRQRRFFFYDGMQMEIGPAQRDYAPPPVYRNATAVHAAGVTLGPEGTLRGYRAGQPFPEVSCREDPHAGAKLIWNFVHRWQGFGAQASFRYSYFDRGEKLPLTYVGTTSAWQLKWRPEPQYEATGGDVFEDEGRALVVGFEVEAPRSAAGTRTLTYRYERSFDAPGKAQPEDTWIWLRDLRRVRKISEVQRANAIAGTDFAFDDLFSFSGLPPQYGWRCLGERNVLAPTNTKRLEHPYEGNGGHGPSGLSFASDRWELRRAVVVEMVPKSATHPYRRKVIWLDRQTHQPLYSFAYDRNGDLWKVIYHNHRWSEDDLGGIDAREWYPGWEGVPEPRDLRVVSDVVANVQTATGSRLDFWDSRGTPPSRTELRRYIDLRRLRKNR